MPTSQWRSRARGALALRQSDASLWHSVVFALNIGVPVLAALVIGDLASGVVGALAGMILTLADSADGLRRRLFLLARSVVVLLSLGCLGYALGGYTPFFWVTFAVLALVTAWLSVGGHAVAPTLRLGAMALVAMAGTPHADSTTVAMLLVAALVAALTRIAGATLFPDAPLISLAPPKADAEAQEATAPGLGVRYCLAYAGTAAAALLLGGVLVARPMWVATTVLLVMQPEPRSSYERIFQRVIGTFVGVVLAALAISVLHSVPTLVLLVLLIALAIPHGSPRNYWLHSALVALLVLVLYDLAAAGRHFDARLFSERVADVLLGCVLALVGTVAAFPPRRRADSKRSAPGT